jgi:hypothetical protein
MYIYIYIYFKKCCLVILCCFLFASVIIGLFVLGLVGHICELGRIYVLLNVSLFYFSLIIDLWLENLDPL